jgi:hypothetical protein
MVGTLHHFARYTCSVMKHFLRSKKVVHRDTAEKVFALHMRVVVETCVFVLCIGLIAAAVFFFLSGSQILTANRERNGVRVHSFIEGGERHVSGSFVTRSDCTHVDVLTDSSSEGDPVVYLTESEEPLCAQYRSAQPYTFAASFPNTSSGPIQVYMNGDRIATVE